MKNITLIVFTIFILFSCCIASKHKDSVDEAEIKNKHLAKDHVIDGPSAEFLVKIADGRLMGIKEGKAAESKGMSKDVRNYGKLMVTDQKHLLTIMKKLAAHKKIMLPVSISDEKKNGLEKLLSKKGENFDDKFIAMMRIDHERDVRLFVNALDSKDEEIRNFALNYLPLIQEHLDKLNAIK